MDISHKELLHLISVKEIFGAFAHEIAQPLNAIIIAAQVIQLKLDRSNLPEDEKSFFYQRLAIVASQVRRATTIVEELRDFSRGSVPWAERADVGGISETIRHLMSQQFTGRNIELVWELEESLHSVKMDPKVVECVIVQALAFARDVSENLAAQHEEKGMDYKKRVHFFAGSSCSDVQVIVKWDPPVLTDGFDAAFEADKHLGIAESRLVLASSDSAIELVDNSLVLRLVGRTDK
jgi:nitrogen fixation/metabolism regulation signal transduction histidine kinase